MKKIGLILVAFLGIVFAGVNAQTTNGTADAVFGQGKITKSDFLKIYLRYPESAAKQNLTGSVFVQVTVKTDGEPVSPVVTKGLSPVLDSEALRLAGLFPYFTPAKKGGKAVESKVTVEIPFVLNDKTKVLDTADEVVSTDSAVKNPLFVIDGKVVNDSINVNAEDIRSIRVIKGRKAIESYGARAADGVVIMTTKN